MGRLQKNSQKQHTESVQKDKKEKESIEDNEEDFEDVEEDEDDSKELSNDPKKVQKTTLYDLLNVSAESSIE